MRAVRGDSGERTDPDQQERTGGNGRWRHRRQMPVVTGKKAGCMCPDAGRVLCLSREEEVVLFYLLPFFFSEVINWE